MRRFSGVMIAGLIGSLSLLLAPVAQADTQRGLSGPDGHIWVTSSSGAHVKSDHDKDGDFNTMTQSDKGVLVYSVFNQAEFPQTVHISVVLDGPGTFEDMTLVDQDFDLGPACSSGEVCTDSEQGSFDFQVRKKDWPAGQYSLIVTGAGSETATVASTFTVAYK